MASFETGWVLIIEDLRDQAELWADVCAEVLRRVIAQQDAV
jgi:hypothetical protein